MESNQETTEKTNKFRPSKKLLLGVAGVVAVVLLLAGGVYGYLYASTPAHMRNPAFEHYHFRTQVVVEGKPVDFSQQKFQEETANGASCSVEISETPVDFHDNMDQMTHVHWDGLTGGEFLKYYGWNYIGGSDDSMGRRFDQGMMGMMNVSTFGQQLPDVPEGTNFYVYVGDENGYEKKSWEDFLNQNLETFFGKQSNLKQNTETSFNFTDWLFPKASAHGGETHEEADSDMSEEELKRINNLIGNVVIFAQEGEPSEDEIQARFDNLVPLQNSTCGG